MEEKKVFWVSLIGAIVCIILAGFCALFKEFIFLKYCAWVFVGIGIFFVVALIFLVVIEVINQKRKTRREE